MSKPIQEDGVESGNGGAVKGRLSRDRICEAAIEAIDEVGLEGVSMRMLAEALGVKASSLYYHFSSKDELMAGVAEYLYRELGQPPGGEKWADELRGTFIQLHDFIQRHPNAAPLLIRDLARSSVAKQRAGVLLRLVGEEGIDSETSHHLLRNLVALLVGHTLLDLWLAEETGGSVEGGPGEGDADDVWVRDLWESGRADFYDNEGQADGDGDADGQGAFAIGLDALIDGFAARVE
jgi:AcrR family transcriptional regulator